MKKVNRLGLKKSIRSTLVTFAIVIAAYLIVQILSAGGLLSNSMQGLLIPICTYIILAVSLNLVVGILGELSLGHAGFMSIGAFSSTIFSVCTQDSIQSAWVRFPLALLIGAVMAGIFGFLIGIPVLRLRGDYLAIVTLAFGEIIKNVFNVLFVGYDETGFHVSLKDTADLGLSESGTVVIKGAQGITGIPQDSTFTLGFVLILLTLLIVINLIHSRSGRAIMSIRDNRIAAESVGINVTKYKLMAFVISAAIAGVAGVLYAHNFSTLVAKKFDYNTSILILVFVVLGGLGNIRGSVIAAVILTLLPELLRGMEDYRMLIYAILLIALMIFNQSPQMIALREKLLPHGIAGLFRRKPAPQPAIAKGPEPIPAEDPQEEVAEPIISTDMTPDGDDTEERG